MYLNQWTKQLEGLGYPRYNFYLHELLSHKANQKVNTFLGIYEK